MRTQPCADCLAKYVQVKDTCPQCSARIPDGNRTHPFKRNTDLLKILAAFRAEKALPKTALSVLSSSFRAWNQSVLPCLSALLFALLVLPHTIWGWLRAVVC